jgi:hypothetical protein
MPNSTPSPLILSASAHVFAAAAYRRAGRMDKWDEHLAAAGRDADALARYPNSQDAVLTRVTTAILRDGLAGRVNMLDELRRSQAAKKNSGLAAEEAMNLFILGRDEEAAKVAGALPDDRPNLCVRFLVALGRPDGREAARQIANHMTRPDVPAPYRVDAAPLLFVAGSPEEFTALARNLRTDGQWPRFAMIDAEEGMAQLGYLEGGLTGTELLNRPAATELERAARRQTAIAWKLLGSGDRHGAEMAFGKAYDGMATSTNAWWLARGVVIRMKKDKTWPKWYAEKK